MYYYDTILIDRAVLILLMEWLELEPDDHHEFICIANMSALHLWAASLLWNMLKHTLWFDIQNNG
jgi:hypothetical protein